MEYGKTIILYSPIVWQLNIWGFLHSYGRHTGHWSSPPHAGVCLLLTGDLPAFIQSFSYFLWWRLCSFSSSSHSPGLNIAPLFVCVVGNWSNSKPPTSSSRLRGVVDGRRPLSCRQSSSSSAAVTLRGENQVPLPLPQLSDIGQNMFCDCCFLVTLWYSFMTDHSISSPPTKAWCFSI